MLTVEASALPEVKIITPRRIEDARGFFSEVWNRKRFAEAGLDHNYVQINHSLSVERGTLRGLHFQSPPFAQSKLVSVARGSIIDVSVDIRRNSPYFGRHVAVELSAENGRQLLIPVGFAHGFCTLEPNTEVVYHVTAYYAGNHDHGVAFDDPDLGIAWPFPSETLVLSDKDRRHPRLADLPPHFA